jgi:hypothetical protein
MRCASLSETVINDMENGDLKGEEDQTLLSAAVVMSDNGYSVI